MRAMTTAVNAGIEFCNQTSLPFENVTASGARLRRFPCVSSPLLRRAGTPRSPLHSFSDTFKPRCASAGMQTAVSQSRPAVKPWFRSEALKRYIALL